VDNIHDFEKYYMKILTYFSQKFNELLSQ